MQCEGRIHRIGQEEKCECRYLTAPHTVDVDMWKKLLDKQQTLGAVMDGEDAQSMAASQKSPGRAHGQQTLDFRKKDTAAEATAKMFANARKKKKRPLADSANHSSGGFDGGDAITLDDDFEDSSAAADMSSLPSAAAGSSGMARPRKQARTSSSNKRPSDRIGLGFDDDDGESVFPANGGGYGSSATASFSSSGSSLGDQLLRDAAARDARESATAPRRSGSGKAAASMAAAAAAGSGGANAGGAVASGGGRGRGRGGRGSGTGPRGGHGSKKATKKRPKKVALPGGYHGFSGWLKDAFPLDDEAWPARLP